MNKHQADRHAPRTTTQPPPPAPPRPQSHPPHARSWVGRLLAEPSVRITLLAWLAANVAVVLLARGHLPFQRPAVAGRSYLGQLLAPNVAMLEVLGLIAVAFALTRNRVIPEHIHPRQDERFTILAGKAHFTLNGEKHVAGPGQTVVVPAGVPHSVANPGPAQIDSIVERRPALQAKEFHEAAAGLAADGKTTPTGVPKNPLQLGATFWHFRHDSRVTSTPIWVQNLMFPPLWALAKVFGVRPYHHRWDSRI